MDNTHHLWYKFNNYIEDVVVKNTCNANSIAVDVGCYAGRFTWYMGKLSQITFAFDPSPVLLLRKNQWPEMPWTNPAGVDNVVFVNCGVGDKQQMLTYTEYDDPTWNSLYHGEFKRAKELAKQSEKKVVVVKLDDMISGNVSFLKIDAEGGDLQVLQGARRLIQSSLPIIAVEASTPVNRRKIIDLLSGIGYNVWHMGSVMKDPTNDHTVPSLNLLAIHKTDYKKDNLLAEVNRFVVECSDKDHNFMLKWIIDYTGK